tara:strand:+ start:2767 stop:3291 length:525 start_codon:yes stop_codon:yes gene_type:complete
MNPFSLLKGAGKAIGNTASFFGTGATMGKRVPHIGLNAETMGITAPSMFYGMPMVYDIAKGGVQAARRSVGGSGGEIQAIRNARAQAEAMQMQQMHMQQQKQGISKNIAQLAATNPHLYNQILAGRTLPQGSVVLGGKPRVDLLEDLALRMGPPAQQPAPQGGAFFQDLASQPF